MKGHRHIKTVLLLIGSVLAAIQFAQAQEPKKIWRIGYLSSFDAGSESSRSEAIRLQLHELGYSDGQNIAIEYRYSEGKVDRLPELAAELVRLKVRSDRGSRRRLADPGCEESDQDNSDRNGGHRRRSCRGGSG
jgi:hypothetical protein